MSYCIFDNDCDVYVWDSEGGYGLMISKGRVGPPPEDIYGNTFNAVDLLEFLKENIDPIDHPEAGQQYFFTNPQGLYEKLMELRREGFMVPDYALDNVLRDIEKT